MQEQPPIGQASAEPFVCYLLANEFYNYVCDIICYDICLTETEPTQCLKAAAEL